jgi:hypothetical protein
VVKSQPEKGGQSSILTFKSHGNPDKSMRTSGLSRAKRGWRVEWNPQSRGDRVFQEEKPGGAPTVEATWACSCPV